MGAIKRLQLSLLVLLIGGEAALSLSVPAGPSELHARDRGLLETSTLKAAVLAEQGQQYYRAVAERNFQGRVLGYVTPWNNHGYEVAQRWRAKFTHISPVWYQLKAADAAAAAAATEFQLTGGHDVDQDWIARLREPIKAADCADGDASSQTCKADLTLSPPRIVPRVIVELAPKQLMHLLQKPGPAIELIVNEVEQRGFDGIVLECWLQWAAMGGFRDADFKRAALAFMTKLALNLREQGKELLVAIPPLVPAQPGRPVADVADLQQLADVVTGFSLMTYDYSGAPGSPGPNAPLPWQEENVREMLGDDDGDSDASPGKLSGSQVLMGINFYGLDYVKPAPGRTSGRPDARPLLAGDFLAVLRRHKPKLKWEEQHAEHRARYQEGETRHTVYCPTPASVAVRIKLAQDLGVSLSIWELGQGMDSFLDLL